MKYLLLLIAILAIFLALGHFFARKTVRSELVIDAPVEKVWAVIADASKYPEWNPTMRVTEGTVAEGNTVAYQFTDSTGTKSIINTTVKQIIPNELLRQAGGIPTIITYDNFYHVEVVNNKQTKVSITENYTGVYVWFWNADTVEKAYEKQNEALKARVEKVN